MLVPWKFIDFELNPQFHAYAVWKWSPHPQKELGSFVKPVSSEFSPLNFRPQELVAILKFGLHNPTHKVCGKPCFFWFMDVYHNGIRNNPHIIG